MAPMMGGISMAPVIQPQASLGTATMTTGSLNMGPRMANGAAGQAGGMWMSFHVYFYFMCFKSFL